MTFTAVRPCLGAVALFSVLALGAACTGSGSTLLSPTGPSASVNRSLAAVTPTPPDPCAPALARTTTTIPDPTPVPPECILQGRFTGGGFQINANDVKVTRGFTLHCDELLSNNFEVNWKDANGSAHHFHTDKNPEVTECSKPVLPNPPDAGVSRIVILNQPGKLDGENDPTHLITIVLWEGALSVTAVYSAEPQRLPCGHLLPCLGSSPAADA